MTRTEILDLCNADLRGADLSGADLHTAYGLQTLATGVTAVRVPTGKRPRSISHVRRMRQDGSGA